MPKNSKARIDANRRYSEKTYDRLYPFVPKGRKVEIQAVADARGESLNDFIVKAIDERMERINAVDSKFTDVSNKSEKKEVNKK